MFRMHQSNIRLHYDFITNNINKFLQSTTYLIVFELLNPIYPTESLS